MEQALINWAIGALSTLVGVVGLLVGVIFKSVVDSQKNQQKINRDTLERIQKIELLVAGQYPTRSEFDGRISALFAKLDKIQDMLNNKADK